MKIDVTLSKACALASFILAFIGAVELGVNGTLDPKWLGYGALAALALSAVL